MVALGVMTVLSLLLAAVLSSPDDPAITLSGWAKAAPGDLVATAAGELAGTTTSATYGPPYNHAAAGQSVLGLPLQRWGGVGTPVSSADLVLQPLRQVSGDPPLRPRCDRGTRCLPQRGEQPPTRTPTPSPRRPGGARAA